MVYFAVHVTEFRYVPRVLILAFMLAGAIPATLAMLKSRWPMGSEHF